MVRQADNLWVFNLTNREGLSHIQPAAHIDPETLFAVATSLPPRRLLMIGKAIQDYPFLIETKILSVKMAGGTKLLFVRG